MLAQVLDVINKPQRCCSFWCTTYTPIADYAFISFSIVYVVLCECSQRTVVENLHSVVEETISHRNYFSISLFLLSRNDTSSSHSWNDFPETLQTSKRWTDRWKICRKKSWLNVCFQNACMGEWRHLCIYAFSRRFYPKRITVHSGYTCFISMCVPWESNPQPFALLTQCSTTEPQEQQQDNRELMTLSKQRSNQLNWHSTIDTALLNTWLADCKIMIKIYYNFTKLHIIIWGNWLQCLPNSVLTKFGVGNFF